MHSFMVMPHRLVSSSRYFIRAAGLSMFCRAGEKEYFLASAFEEVYAPPSASISLRGISVSGTFLRGVLEKVRGAAQLEAVASGVPSLPMPPC